MKPVSGETRATTPVRQGQGVVFDPLAKRFEERIYGHTKGRLRLALLLRDLLEKVPGFAAGSLDVLDLGGGTGRCARCCARRGHQVRLVDASAEMLAIAAQKEALGKRGAGRLQFARHDIVSDPPRPEWAADLVLLHGVAEWAQEPEAVIEKALGYVREQGYLSLLVFNPDRLLLKRGVGGQPTGPGYAASKRRLTPLAGRTPAQLRSLLAAHGGEIVLQSGIRVFQGFLREIRLEHLSVADWLQREVGHYRREPFASLGEHTHLLWQRR